MTRYYDFVLGTIPITLVGIPCLSQLAGFNLMKSVFLGGLIAAGIMGHALFLNAPTDPPHNPSR